MGSKTQTVSNELSDQYTRENLMPLAAGIRDMEFEQYSGARQAGTNQVIDDAITGVSNLALPTELAQFTSQMSRTPQERQAQIAEIQDYLSPALFRQYQQEGIQKEADQIKNNAFGDRSAVYEGERRAAFDANLYGLASDELRKRDAEALQGIQGLGAATGVLGQQLALGQALQQIESIPAAEEYRDYLFEQQFPLSQFAAVTGGAGALPNYGTTTTRDPMGSTGALLAGVGAFGQGFPKFFSDVRLKKNITPYADLRGVKFYKWEWNAKANKKGLYGADIGVLAHEIEETRPHLVSASEDGYKKVNYDQLYAEIS